MNKAMLSTLRPFPPDRPDIIELAKRVGAQARVGQSAGAGVA